MIQAVEPRRANRNVLDDIAEQAVSKFSAPEDQRKWALRKVLADKAFLEEYMTPIVAEAIARRIYILRSASRASLKRVGKPRGAEAIIAAGENYMVNFLAEWIVGNKPLGLCTKKEVRVAREHELAQAFGHNRNAKMYAAIEKMIPDDDGIVQDFVTTEKANKLSEEIYK